MSRYFLLLFIMLVQLGFSQQNYTIKGTISGYGMKKVYLQKFYGHKVRIIDSTLTGVPGTFDFNITDQKYIGIYRIKFEKDKSIDLVFNNEHIEFSTSLNNLVQEMKILNSSENELLYKYLKFKEINDNKLNLLNQLILNYPKEDPFYKKISTQFLKLQDEEVTYAKNVIKKYPDKYFTLVVRYMAIPKIDPVLDEKEQSEYLKAHYFDYVTFTDTTLLNSDLIPSKILSFLTLYMQRGISPEEREKAFQPAIDILMPKVKGNDKIYTYIFEYLIAGFEDLGMNKIIGYLIDHYEPSKICVGNHSGDILNKRIESFKKLAIGKKAPEIEMKDISGKMIKLSDYQDGYVLVVFWYTDCPHCRHLLPVIHGIYQGQKTKKFEVIAVSTDTNGLAWVNFVKANKLSWINCTDLMGWDGKTATDYSIYATPSLFLIDKNGIIVGKPTDEKQLRKLLKENNLL